MNYIKLFPLFFLIFFISISCHRKNPADQQTAITNDTASTQKPASGTGNREVTKYGIKSAIVRFESDIAGSKSVKMLYFDDYGRNEREVFYEGETPKEAFVTVKGSLYKIIYKQKTAFRIGPAKFGSAYKFDWNEVPDSQKKDGHAIKLANIDIAGKSCESYKLDNAGVVTEFAGWKNICVYSKQQSKFGDAVIRAIKIEENVPVSADMFAIPQGFKMK
jgi:hypothetical protein